MIVKSEIEEIKEVAVAEASTEKVEESTSEKPSNVEWSSDEQAPKEASTGWGSKSRKFVGKLKSLLMSSCFHT